MLWQEGGQTLDFLDFWTLCEWLSKEGMLRQKGGQSLDFLDFLRVSL